MISAADRDDKMDGKDGRKKDLFVDKDLALARRGLDRERGRSTVTKEALSQPTGLAGSPLSLRPENCVEGSTPLMKSAACGHSNVVKLLLEKGADARMSNSIGDTALHAAALEGHVDVLRCLVESAGPDYAACAEVLNRQGESPLHYAATNGRIQCIHALIGWGANPNRPSFAGNTPLHKAADRGHAPACEMLLESVIEPGACDSRNAKFCTPLMCAAIGGHVDVIPVLLAAGASINAVDNRQFTSLHLAAEYGHADVCRVLLETGADHSPVCDSGTTPFHRAAVKKHMDAARVLYEGGSRKPCLQSHSGLTPGSSGGGPRCVKCTLAMNLIQKLVKAESDSSAAPSAPLSNTGGLSFEEMELILDEEFGDMSFEEELKRLKEDKDFGLKIRKMKPGLDV